MSLLVPRRPCKVEDIQDTQTDNTRRATSSRSNVSSQVRLSGDIFQVVTYKVRSKIVARLKRGASFDGNIHVLKMPPYDTTRELNEDANE